MISYDAGAASYDQLSVRWSRLYIPTLLAQAGIAVGHRVLDVATGTGEAAILAGVLVWVWVRGRSAPAGPNTESGVDGPLPVYILATAAVLLGCRSAPPPMPANSGGTAEILARGGWPQVSRAAAKASGPQAYQSTGLWACCSR